MLGSPVVGQGSRGRQLTGPPLTRVSFGVTFIDEDGQYIYDAAMLHEIQFPQVPRLIVPVVDGADD